ncbi:MAG: VacJ family lipoprotein [Gammaproteobacteria bacterium]|nr:VacJ family lipoprotein [Gammaproteobacteria bacterium]
MSSALRSTLVLLTAAALAACASASAQDGGAPTTGEEPGEAGDPFETINRATYRFNDVADTYVLRPVAKTYQKITPRPVRKGVTNFFANLLTPVDIVNNLLQAKFVPALSDTGRLLMNTTLGLGGILDPATDAGLAVHDEDLGQTLAVWGVPAGPYVVLPFLGPSTVRDGLALYPDAQLMPLVQYHDSNVTGKLQILYGINTRERLLSTDRAVANAFDSYVFVREAYLQNRQYKIHDGNPPLDDVYGDYDVYDYEEEPGEE